MKVYIIGALKNKKVPEFANRLHQAGFDPFADWFSPGPEADTFLLEYAKIRGWNYKQALRSDAAKHTFEFDKRHIDEAEVAVMLAPCGKSGHMELGYVIGCKKPAYILFEEYPDRFDVMYNFATDVFDKEEDLIERLKDYRDHRIIQSPFIHPYRVTRGL